MRGILALIGGEDHSQLSPLLSTDNKPMKGGQEYPNGFSLLVAFIAKDTDNTTTIYRRSIILLPETYYISKAVYISCRPNALDDENLFNPSINVSKGASSWKDFEALAMTEERETYSIEIVD